MAMAIDDLLRVARWARGEGRGPLLEAMLTLAVAEAGPDAAWAERARARLLARRPGHFLGAHKTLARTLADPQVVAAIGKLRGQYPAGRVGWLRLRAEFVAGPFTGADPIPPEAVLDDLLGPPAEADVRRDAAEAIRGPRRREEVEDGAYHVAVLLGIALLLASVGRGRRAGASSEKAIPTLP